MTVTAPQQRVTALQESLRQFLDKLTDALLQCSPVDHFGVPVLRLEAFIQDGHNGIDGTDDNGQSGETKATNAELASRRLAGPVLSHVIDISDLVAHNPDPQALADNSGSHTHSLPAHQPPTKSGHGVSHTTQDRHRDRDQDQDQDQDRDRDSIPADSPPILCSRNATDPNNLRSRNTLSLLRPSRGTLPVQDDTKSQRQIQICDRNFPKRTKTQSAVPIPQESSLEKLIIGIWDHIHGGINLEPRSLIEQWRITASLTTTSPTNSEYPALHESNATPRTPPLPANHSQPANLTDGDSSFSKSSTFCMKITQASRMCRSVEVIVQARWIEHFNAYVEFLGSVNPDMSPTKCRMAALLKACGDFGWSEKELRNKMIIWRGYKEIKDAGGWAALVFAGIGLYRFCKYRVGFTKEGMQRLRTFKTRFEVAADTLHPNWRQLLTIVGEHSAQTKLTGHPHNWVVYTDGSEPVPLASTYLDLDPGFNFEHVDESVIDVHTWGAEDPRWMPPPQLSAASAAVYKCTACGMEQDDDLKRNNCYCYPSLFGCPRSCPPVQVFHTRNGKRNGVQALVPFRRGTAIGEFVGLVTNGIKDLDVMVNSASGRRYQIWQGTIGNFTRFVNHSCNANAQFQPFVWRGTQRILLISKGIEAGKEITVDYSRSYWRGLDKKCLCGEICCRYNKERRQGASS
ncbi:hypothetical protein ACRALDRAFT_2044803 [Sodiomyces alcalophilus JCM 7366]|uniref:uncharacterized protein n=1 Tax=Sodiomyces alcalophilus JCM 7366 TaxID=591952 RepID=UPI0039B6E8BD